MKLFDPNNPNEKKKMIAAGALGLVAIIVLGYVFFGGSSKPPTNIAGRPSPTPRAGTATAQVQDTPIDECAICQPIVYNGSVPAMTEANRNVFAFYEPPPPTPRPVVGGTPTPTPTPP